MTITHTYSSTAETSPGRVAIQTESEQITYHDWDRLVSQTANWLRSQPSMPNRVAILLPNSLAFLQLFAGAAAAGCTAIPIDTRWSPAECKERLSISNADLVVTLAFFKNKLTDSQTPVVLLDNCMADISEAAADPLPTIDPEHPFIWDLRRARQENRRPLRDLTAHGWRALPVQKQIFRFHQMIRF